MIGPLVAFLLAAQVYLGGVATWYGTGPGAAHAAAGPLLRHALGSTWRGRWVGVCRVGTVRCVRVRLTDWCACPYGRRVIDLPTQDFRRLAPLGRGIVSVRVTW